jgi:hypothetical protein
VSAVWVFIRDVADGLKIVTLAVILEFRRDSGDI